MATVEKFSRPKFLYVTITVAMEYTVAAVYKAIYQRRESLLTVFLMRLASQTAFNANKMPVPA